MAVIWDSLETYYRQASRSTQIESLALNLARLHLLATDGTENTIAQHLVRESQFFIEWIVPTLDLETQMELAAELVELQRLLSRWKLSWSDIWFQDNQRQDMAALAQQWCDRHSIQNSK